MADSLGSLLQARRLELQLGLREVSAISGVSRGRLSLMERDLSHPEIPTLERLATVLELDFDELLQFAGYPKRSLPSLPVYLRQVYGLSEHSAADVERYLADNHGVVAAPAPGEDEQPEEQDT